ncbi:MAG: hypothetical protein JXA67_14610 [Micromonosporaceae bacterium]|nr:hypothetical protein [Micromonosporaceae bacterium]
MSAARHVRGRVGSAWTIQLDSPVKMVQQGTSSPIVVVTDHGMVAIDTRTTGGCLAGAWIIGSG